MSPHTARRNRSIATSGPWDRYAALSGAIPAAASLGTEQATRRRLEQRDRSRLHVVAARHGQGDQTAVRVADQVSVIETDVVQQPSRQNSASSSMPNPGRPLGGVVGSAARSTTPRARRAASTTRRTVARAGMRPARRCRRPRSPLRRHRDRYDCSGSSDWSLIPRPNRACGRRQRDGFSSRPGAQPDRENVLRPRRDVGIG